MSGDGESSSNFVVKFVSNLHVEGHTVYIIKVTPPSGEPWEIRKRYREIRDLHDQLRVRYGDATPAMPARRVFGALDPTFIAQRQRQLQQYMDDVMRLENAREMLSTAMLTFLNAPTIRGQCSLPARQHAQILDSMHHRLMNLSMPPTPVEEEDKEQRLVKYRNAMRLHVLSQPVDPIHLRGPSFDTEPLPFAPGGSVEAVKAAGPKRMPEGQAVMELLDKLHEVLSTDNEIAKPEKLIIAFPPVGREPKAEAQAGG